MGKPSTEQEYQFLTIDERLEMARRAIHQTEAQIVALDMDITANRAVVAIAPAGLIEGTKNDLRTLELKRYAQSIARGVFSEVYKKLVALKAQEDLSLTAAAEEQARTAAAEEASKLLDFEAEKAKRAPTGEVGEEEDKA